MYCHFRTPQINDSDYGMQGYTSASRPCPSDLGYRFYVDQLMQDRESDEEERLELVKKGNI